MKSVKATIAFWSLLIISQIHALGLNLIEERTWVDVFIAIAWVILTVVALIFLIITMSKRRKNDRPRNFSENKK